MRYFLHIARTGSDDADRRRIELGPGFAHHTVYSYVLLTAFTLMIVELLYNSQSLYRGQALALFTGTICTLALNVITIFGLVDIHLTPIGVILSGTLYSVAIIRYRLTDIVPIARDRVLDHVSDGVFVLDRDDRLIDVNPVGRTLLQDLDSAPIGERVDSLFAPVPKLKDEYAALTEIRTDDEREIELDGDYFYAQVTPIDDGRDRHVGWLLIIRDVTDRKRREAQLKRQNERLERFADVVSHDLRNPLNVADGYLELASEADDPESHLHKIEQSHDRMEAIIEDVLTIAREGDAVSDTEPVALGELAERAWATVDSGDATLTVASDKPFLADPGRMRRLLENLFRNAIEHGRTDDSDPDGTDGASGSGGSPLHVEVGNLELDTTDESAGFYVADDGRGLPADRDRVFEDGYTTDAKGTGFGLRIVRGIATAHDWEVDATVGEADGAGFEFLGVETVTDTGPSDSVVSPDSEGKPASS
ncbi:histidine kinase N-terminal 7TM domain-containing protein [Natrinema halophilum]|uniref:histidine kinase n=1 Tax=Natrinema halophilum TaxID=1699371 RepID=A0A7D5KZ07_9EURY|nr:histidine kinase N-terminal 7TM domain-containing protein [Natrinema halophilum]QLG48200.1 PAS domain-containing protein [Natrinema halophilum]